ncbi:MAG TPA: acetyl-CoA carboxylase, carboxyltransferase subunit beta [Chloroflexia bacterium]|nr:acetyl-CoA carboxylase, carboxyltransferase subunit beta [Chloroflexia bacterium]
MDKIFKRATKGAEEQDLDKDKESKKESISSDASDGSGKKQPADGHAPKFGWSVKPQGDGKSSKKTQPGNKDIPDDLWVKCTHCKELIYSKEFENNKKVCHKCGHHFRLSARERIALLLDESTFEELNASLVTGDPLSFKSPTELPYAEKVVETRRKTGLNEAMVTGIGTLEGLSLAIAVADFSFQGGSMGAVFGEKLVRLVEEAARRHIPVLTVSASGGARMHEGIFSLMQMAKTTAAFALLGEAGVPHFSLLTDPCTGGVSASYASVADIIIAEPGALIGFAGPRVIESTTKQKLPPGFQTAEFLLEHGMLDQVVARKDLRATLAGLLQFYKLASTNATSNLEREVVGYAG